MRLKPVLFSVLVSCLGVLAATATVQAQATATSFSQLQVLVQVGDTVRVTDTTGREVSGRIAELTPSSFAIVTDGARKAFLESEVALIRQRRPDSLGNGALWGLTVGGVIGGLWAGAFDNDAGQVAAGVLFFGGVGAGIGVAMDALIVGQRAIFSRPSRSSARVTVAPIVTRAQRGALFSLGF